MICDRRVFVIFTLSFFYSVVFYAQDCCRITGIAGLSDLGTNMVVYVQVLNKEGDKLISFTATDEHGGFSCSGLPCTSYKVRFTQLGYRDTFVELVCFGNVDLAPVMLSPLSVELDEISVIDKMVLLKKSGDTTIYNINAFKRGDERSAQDIIERIPGFEFQGKTLKYQGINIDRILVDGYAISDEDHLQWTNTIPIQIMDNIRLIEQYERSGDRIKDSTLVSLYLDIALKKSSRNRVHGRLELFGGYSHHYSGLIDLFSLGNKFGHRVSIQGSTLPDQNDGIELDDFIRNAVVDFKYRNWLRLYRSFDDSKLSISGDYKINTIKGVNVKIFGEGQVAKGIKHSHYFQYYSYASTFQQVALQFNFQDFSTLFSTEDDQRSTNILRGNIEESFSFNRHLKLDVFVPFSLSFGKALSTQTNILDSAQFVNFQKKNRHTGKARPYYTLEYRPLPGFDISLFGEYDYNKDTDGIDLSSSDSIDIVFVFNDSDDQYKSNQHRNLISSNYFQKLKMEQSFGRFRLGYHANFTYGLEKLKLKSDLYDFGPYVGNEKFNATTAEHGIVLRYINRRIEFSFGGQQAAMQLNFQNRRVNNRIPFLPILSVKVPVFTKWYFVFSYNARYEHPNLNIVMPLIFIEDQVRRFRSNSKINDLSDYHTFNLTLNRVIEFSENPQFFNVGISYTPESRIFAQTFSIESLILYQGLSLIRQSNLWNASCVFSKRIDNFQLRSRGHFIASVSHFENVHVKHSSGMLDFSIVYNKSKDWSVNISSNLNIFQSISSQVVVNNTFLGVATQGNYRHGLFDHRLHYTVFANFISKTSNIYHRLNYNFQIRPSNSRFVYFLAGNDLLNLRPRTRSLSSFQAGMFRTVFFEEPAGQLLAGVRFYLVDGLKKID